MTHGTIKQVYRNNKKNNSNNNNIENMIEKS